MRALLCILIPKEAIDDISRLQVPYPGSSWLEPDALSIPLFWLEDLSGNDIIDLNQELDLFEHPMLTLTLSNIDITKSGQVYLQFNIPDDFIFKLRSALKTIKRQNIRTAANRLYLGTVPQKLKNKFITFAIGYNKSFLGEQFAIWEDGKYYFEKGRFALGKIKPWPSL